MPLVIGTTPAAFIADLQAVSVATDLHDAPTKLTSALIEDRIIRAPSRALFECAVDNTRRAGLLADYTESVAALRRSGLIRQKASLTTFHLPDREPKDEVWSRYFSGTPNDSLLFEQLQRERMALTKLVRYSGCRLMVDPITALPRVYWRHAESVALRVSGLVAFLRDKAVRNVSVAIGHDHLRHESLTVVGDWFSSEALSSGEEQVLRNAIFTRHAPTIHRQVRSFDQEFDDRLHAADWSANSSRGNSIEYYEAYLRGAVTDRIRNR